MTRTILENRADLKIGVIGLGYVGLPLAVEFAKLYPVFGLDLNEKRIEELVSGYDRTLEISEAELREAEFLRVTKSIHDLSKCNVFIVTVPTPINVDKTPDLGPLISASQAIAGLLKKGDTVIYESTVYPGATEEVCVPLLEDGSNMLLNCDFYVGYSPERINPGDKKQSIRSIKKVTSGSSPSSANFIDALYASIIDAGTHLAQSIRVAEAAKVIENTQRDVNIALMNELAIIFDKLHISSADVFDAASTKWNFLPFEPGLVGGHCISVDPYYLTHKAQSIGYIPEVILSGRRINDQMGEFIANRFIRDALNAGLVEGSKKVLVMGLTFKENCPDVRNSKVIDIIEVLEEASFEIEIFDPHVSPADLPGRLRSKLVNEIHASRYMGVIVAVKHSNFTKIGVKKIRAACLGGGLVFDIKSIFHKDEVDFQL
jgi:UDP-N-acetyl-D-glucosamine/UDP-N-acetyl-D-galactosamine dehydrogenase